MYIIPNLMDLAIRVLAWSCRINTGQFLCYFHSEDRLPRYWALYGSPAPAVLELLVRAGADVNTRASPRWTSLHLVALLDPVLFPILLDLGADLDTLD